MPVSWNSELMLNQKAADVLAPGSTFNVVQTSDGGAVYLSIGTDHTFCMTREVEASVLGWEHADQSSSLSSNHDGQPVVAKSFAVSQNHRSLTFDLALVVSVAGSDHLYFSCSNPPESEVLGRGLAFTACPFDGEGKPGAELQIADVFLMIMPGQQGAVPIPNCFVDVVRQPGDPLQLLDRYYINPDAVPGTPRWTRHRLDIELAAGSISSCLGQRSRDRIPGIYTFGAIVGKQELVYTPQRNIYRPDVAPNSATLALPSGSTSIATSLDKNGYTNLFVSANGGVYLWTPDNQGEQASPLQIMAADPELGLLSDLKGLLVTTSGGRTQICGLNSQGDLVHMYCPAGAEASPSAWSSPIPLASDIQSYSFYLDSKTGNTVLFADHVNNGLLQLSENPITTSWAERRVLLPPTSYDNFTEYHSFTTHISVSNKNAMPITDRDVKLQLTAATPVSVYIDNNYHVLGPGSPLCVPIGAAGTLTVIQETQNFEAAVFTVTIVGDQVPADDSDVVLIRPMNNLEQTLSLIKSGDDLGSVMIEADDGTKKPLITQGISEDVKKAAAQAIAGLMDINTSLPKDGSVKPPTKPTSIFQSNSPLEMIDYPTTWGVSFQEGNAKYVEGDEAMLLLVSDSKKRKRLANAPNPITLGDIGTTIKAKAGAFFRWVKRIWHKVAKFITHEIDGIEYLFCTIADKIYQVALDCYHAVAGALEFVFTQVKTFFEDLVKWLGFIFNWGDILRTHSVLKNLLTRYSENMIAQFDNIEQHIEEAFIGLEEKLNALTDVTDSGETIGTHAELARKLPGSDLPQANWGLYHAVHGAEVARIPGLQATLGDDVMDHVKAVLEVLTKAVENEAAYLKTTIDQLKTRVIDSLMSHRPVEAMKKVLGILGDLFLKSTRNIIVALIDIVKFVSKGFLDTLKATLHIPVLSWVYKKITHGNDLSVLDLFCLIGAIAATSAYKIVVNRAPYPDSAQTYALINADSWETLRDVMMAPAASFQATHIPHHGDKHHHHHHHRHETHHNHNPLSTTPTGTSLAQALTNLAASLGGIFLLTTSPLPRTKTIRTLTLTSYLLLVSPNFIPNFTIPQDWISRYNNLNTWFCILKTAGDNFVWYNTGFMQDCSPIVEGVLNAAWFVPSCGWLGVAMDGDKQGGMRFSDFLSFLGGLFGLGYAVGSGLSADCWGVEVKGVGVGMARGFSAGYCGVSWGVGVGLLMGN